MSQRGRERGRGPGRELIYDALLMSNQRPSPRAVSILASCFLTLLAVVTHAGAEEAVPPAEAVKPEVPVSIPVASIAIEAATLESFLKRVVSKLFLPPARNPCLL